MEHQEIIEIFSKYDTYGIIVSAFMGFAWWLILMSIAINKYVDIYLKIKKNNKIEKGTS